MQTPEVLVDRGTRLFRFLARSQQLRTAAIPATDRYEREGAVHWLAKVPDHPAIHVGGRDEASSDDDVLVLSIDRVPKTPAPPLPAILQVWVDGDPESLQEPTLRRERRAPFGVRGEAGDTADRIERSEDRPEIQHAFSLWLAEWQRWATKESVDRPVRELYGRLFRTHMSSVQRGEEMELILGAGLLSWHPDSSQPVSRHVFTVPVVGVIDDQSGSLTFSLDTSAIGAKVELDMLDPSLVPEGSVVTALNQAGAEFGGSLLHEDEIAPLAKSLVNKLAAEGRYDPSIERSDPIVDPVIAWAPALILRLRSNTGLVAAFDHIADEIAETGDVPAGLLPLLDPDRTPSTQPDPSAGALLDVDGEIYSPLPLNQKQRDIIDRVDRNAQTIVQGPPGTGKTHTAAALLSHLLAQGKRVLVTAHTDRALGEVRSKLPAQVRPLAVSVIGSSRSDMADLKVAVETIGRRSVEHDHADAQRQIQESLNDIERLRVRRVALAEQLVASRERETYVMTHAGYEGTLAQIAQRCQSEATAFDWLAPLVDFAPGTSAPLTNAEAIRWHALLVDPVLVRDGDEAQRRHVRRSGLITPEELVRLLAALNSAAAEAESHASALAHPSVPALRRLPDEKRRALVKALREVLASIRLAETFPGAWVSRAVSDTRAGFAHAWFDRVQAISALVERVGQGVHAIGFGVVVEVNGDHGQIGALAANLQDHLAAGGTVKLHPDGTPKIGMFTGSAVKASKPLFDQVRVAGVPPTTPEQLDTVLRYLDNARLLDELDRSWPDDTPIPQEDTHRERFSWHAGELEQLKQVAAISDLIGAAVRLLNEAGAAPPDWRSNESIEAVLAAAAGVEASQAADSAGAPLDALLATLRDELALGGTATADQELLDAAAAGDVAAYAAAWARLDELEETAARLQERSSLSDRIWAGARRLAAAVIEDRTDEGWSRKLSQLEEAWAWGTTEAWIKQQESLDVNAVQNEIKDVEHRIRAHVESVAALRAWNHAVGSDRLTPGSRADLTQYAQLVRRLGKGTGKYAAHQRAEIKQAMDRCRPAVPVWILPIYRLADQLRIEQNMFDVVLIDEASQAGLEATFLQYLAPKIVVIGDDKQVSPSAVGVDQEQLRKLADQYLYDDRYKASWQDPKRSLFDDALMRFGGQITLVEHRRCVPEIIGFSNRIAYEPDNIRLQPVRQFGADRLTPIKMVHVQDGLMTGTSSNRVNKPEARALVDALKACLDDPRYDGKTFGVISLSGRRQAQYIETLLLHEVTAEDWAARELRVGDAPDFQGSERHVMFLSMVSAWEPGTRMAALTQEMFVQRYNVAVSRAQDQLWLFHTVSIDQVPREDDMRHQLLAYCDEIVRHGPDLGASTSALVADDVRVAPFDSLFEQRVHNRIVERGFTVLPQWAEQGYLIDLVVIGASTRLAIECDGDAWHGPDAYQRDLARQRELERCGWTFCRIRESEFYVDGHAAMSKVWDALAELDITPYEAPAEVDEATLGADVEDAENRQAHLQAQLRSENEWVPADHSSAVDADPSAHPAEVVPTPSDAPEASVDETSGFDSPQQLRADTSTHDAVLAPEPEPAAEPDDLVPGLTLAEYEEFRGSVPPVADAAPKDVIAGLVEIVAVEGPILGERLRSGYVNHSGGRRVGRATATVLNEALKRALSTGVLVSDNPLRVAGFSEQAFRLPDQPEIRPRTLGTRSLEHVPAAELAQMMREAALHHAGAGAPDVYRAVLARLGRKALTATAQAQFDRVMTGLLADDPALAASPLDGVDDGPSTSLTAATAALMGQDDAVRAVLDLVEARGRIARADVVTMTGYEPARATALLGDLTAAGHLERRGERRGAHYVLPTDPATSESSLRPFATDGSDE